MGLGLRAMWDSSIAKMRKTYHSVIGTRNWFWKCRLEAMCRNSESSGIGSDFERSVLPYCYQIQ